jgi:hypothetical protein
MNRLRGEHLANLVAGERELARLEARRKKPVESIMEGVPDSEVKVADTNAGWGASGPAVSDERGMTHDKPRGSRFVVPAVDHDPNARIGADVSSDRRRPHGTSR